mgnify:CR=1 FL=1
MINMKRDKSAAVGLVICFVALITIVGAITFSNFGKKSEEKPSDTEDKMQAELDTEEEEEEETQVSQGDNIQAELPMETPAIMEQPELSFGENEKLLWPIDGNVLMNYSMDQTIYFATLDQYKYNPALVIEGQVGQDVRSVKEGEVILIEKNADTGNTVTVSLGDGYEAKYGQLGEVLVTQGERISQGDLIGYLGEPTKYYTVEGCNLYFQLLKDGEPVNPLEYLDV